MVLLALIPMFNDDVVVDFSLDKSKVLGTPG